MVQNYQNILVATDGSAQAQAAFDQAMALAQTYKAKLYVVQVVIPPYFTSRSETGGVILRDMINEAKANLAQLVDQAKADGFANIEAIQAEGSPRDIISKKLPEELNIDLIVLGATGRTTTEKLFLGSVSEYVTRHAKAQILIVR
ncbi:universal stress protein [Agrilactobacillus yilanensis]|uniref:Universal stress protein n=1 Tax=Agrilactobacillus yilanensis TaxID=2485997 RepID=A0ABW4J2P8_9LACO|nr:universal stress protein [Agrilactobacillus yilanensis]